MRSSPVSHHFFHISKPLYLSLIQVPGKKIPHKNGHNKDKEGDGTGMLKWTVGSRLRGWEMDGSGSGSCPMAGGLWY
jgi:hypothetical protein